MTEQQAATRRGFWCECHTVTEPNTLTFAGSFDAYSPHQAVRWIRVALRTITPALDGAAAELAWNWINHGHTQALSELSTGQPYVLTLNARGTALTWTARPVLYLPLAHRQGQQLPTCAERLPDC